jgi:hypothetical protein
VTISLSRTDQCPLTILLSTPRIPSGAADIRQMRIRPGRGAVYLGPLVPPIARHSSAPIAQQAERLHGKEKVCGSIPHGGSVSVSDATAHRRNMRSIRTVARPGKLVGRPQRDSSGGRASGS